MRRPTTAFPAFLALAGAAILASRALGEDVENAGRRYARVTEADLSQAAPGWDGRRVFLDAKFVNFFNGVLSLERVPEGRVRLGDDPNGLFVDALSNFKTPKPDGKQLTNVKHEKGKPRSNVRVFGVGRVEDQSPVIVLEGIVKLPDDADAFNAELEELHKRPDGQQKPDDYYKLAQKAHARADRDKVDLSRVIDQANKDGFGLEKKLRKKGDAKSAIALGKKGMELLGEGAADDAIQLWGEVAVDREKLFDEKEKEEALGLLRKHRAYLWRGEYVSYATFKVGVGFIQRRGQWVRKQHAELEDAIDRELKKVGENPRQLLDYGPWISKGQVVRGMKKDEIIRAVRFPIYVERKVFKDDRTNRKIVAEQWIFEDLDKGMRVYLWNGDCSEVKAKGADWPTS